MTGAGTISNPYEIASQVVSNIEILDTTSYLTIYNCTVDNPTMTGILLENCMNVDVEGCEVKHGYQGICLIGCANSNVHWCVVDNSTINNLLVVNCDGVEVQDGLYKNAGYGCINLTSDNSPEILGLDAYVPDTCHYFVYISPGTVDAMIEMNDVLTKIATPIIDNGTSSYFSGNTFMTSEPQDKNPPVTPPPNPTPNAPQSPLATIIPIAILLIFIVVVIGLLVVHPQKKVKRKAPRPTRPKIPAPTKPRVIVNGVIYSIEDGNLLLNARALNRIKFDSIDNNKGLHEYPITRLDLRNNYIDSISFIEALPDLIELDISHNAITSIDGVTFPEHFTTLIANDNKITSVNFTAHCPITRLDLANNQITRISGIQPLTNIKYLRLVGNPIPASVIEAFGGLSNRGLVKNLGLFYTVVEDDLVPTPAAVETLDQIDNELLENKATIVGEINALAPKKDLLASVLVKKVPLSLNALIAFFFEKYKIGIKVISRHTILDAFAKERGLFANLDNLLHELAKANLIASQREEISIGDAFAIQEFCQALKARNLKDKDLLDVLVGLKDVPPAKKVSNLQNILPMKLITKLSSS